MVESNAVPGGNGKNPSKPPLKEEAYQLTNQMIENIQLICQYKS